MPSVPRPTQVTLNRDEGFLIIAWSDGRTCHYPLSHLREACPCVECRGGHHNMGLAKAPKDILSLLPARSYKVEAMELVGNYALQFTWDDQHNTGIYTWEYLHKLCPDSMHDTLV